MSNSNEKFMPLKRKIENIITDLLTNGSYEDLMGLQDSELCGEISIFLQDELENKMSKVELHDVSVNILGKQTKCSSKDCPEIRELKMGKQNRTKQEICQDISIFYVRILNIISSIITAVDYDNNMCIRRLRALFDRIDDKEGKVSVCTDDSKLYPSSFLKVEGMSHLLKLYKMYDIPGSSKTNEEKRREIERLQLDIKKFFKEPGSDFSGDNVNNTRTNNQIVSASIKSQLEKIESNVRGVKKGLVNMKDVFRRKGVINNQNAQAITVNNNQGNQGNQNNQNNQASRNKKSPSNRNANNNVSRESNASVDVNNKKPNNNNMDEEEPENNLENLDNEEGNAKPANINAISGNEEENVMTQKGGKNRKGTRKKTRKSKGKKKNKKSKRNKLRTQTGGLGFLRKAFGAEPAKIEDNAIDNLDNSLINDRAKNKKTVSDLVKLVGDKKITEIKLLAGSEPKVGYVPTNLSKKPECQGGELDTTIDITDSKFKNFSRKYKEFENHYSNNSVELLNFLESNVLKKAQNGRYILKKFDLLQLDGIEKETRKRLIEYYSKCQNLFTESFFELVKVLVSSRNQEVSEENTEGLSQNELQEKSIEVNDLAASN